MQMDSAGYSLSADHLVLIELPCQNLKGRLNDATSQPQHQVQG